MDFIADSHLIPVLQNGALPVGSLSAVEQYLLDNIDGKRTVEQLGELCGLELEITGKMVGKLLKAGLLQANDQKAAEAHSEPVRTSSREPDRSVDSATAGDSDNEGADQGVSVAAVTEFFSSLDHLNYYELLGIPPNAERSEIRSAYFSLSKKFHPDTYFLNDDTALKTKLSRIFSRLTVAYETLSGKSKRKQYDATIADEIELWKLGHSLKQSVEAASREEGSGTGKEVSPAIGDSAIEDERERRARPSISQRLSAMPSSRTGYRRTPVQDDVVVNIGPRISRVPVTRTSRSVETAPAERPGASVAGGKMNAGATTAVSSGFEAPKGEDTLSSEQRERRREQWRRDRLKKAMGSVPSTSPIGSRGIGRMHSVSEAGLKDQARLAIEQQHFEHAIQYIQELLRRDGENTVAAQMLKEAQDGKLKSDVNELIRRGRYEQSQGNMQTALELYERAYKLDIRNDEAKFHIAALLLEIRKDLRRALQLLREIVGMGARKPQYYTALADLYELTNERGRALQTIQRALDLNPADPELRRRLKSMSKK